MSDHADEKTPELDPPDAENPAESPETEAHKRQHRGDPAEVEAHKKNFREPTEGRRA